MQKLAFILGNGVSRKPIDIPTLRKNGTVYGCNAIYRTDRVDYLVAVDNRMVTEIVKSGYQKKTPVYTNHKKNFDKYEGLNFFNPRLGWSSGPSAMFLACEHKPTHVYLLGFDYKGVEDGKKVNNIYAGTPNYKKQGDTATYFGNWLNQTTTVIRNNPGIQFTRVIQPDNYCPEELNNFENFNTIHLKEFCTHLRFPPISQNGSF